MTAPIIRTCMEGERQMVTLMVCECCLATTETIPAEWHTARRIVAGDPIVRRGAPRDRCATCRKHDPFLKPCSPR